MALVSDEVTRSAGVDLVFFRVKRRKYMVGSAFRKLKSILDGSFFFFHTFYVHMLWRSRDDLLINPQTPNDGAFSLATFILRICSWLVE